MHRSRSLRALLLTGALGVAAALTALLASGPTSLTSLTAHAKEATEPVDLAEMLAPLREQHGAPALGAAVIRGEDVIAIGVTGVRSNGSTEKVTVADRWHLGSDTKAMTATLIARLVEKKKLTFDRPLAKAFPRVKVHEGFREVTLDQLLRNRGGAPANLNAHGIWASLWQRKGSVRDQRMEVVEGVLTRAPTVEPGKTYVYSNAGFTIVGAAAEVACRAKWETLLARHVCKPLRMKSVGFGAPGRGDSKVKQPWGHRLDGEKLVPVPPGPAADNPPGIGPAGIVHCSLTDWAKFASVHLRGARGEETGFLSQATFRHLHTPLTGQTYALGWGVTDVPEAGGTVLSHDGSNTMWFARIKILPARNVAVLITCNAADAGAKRAVEAATQALLRKYAAK